MDTNLCPICCSCNTVKLITNNKSLVPSAYSINWCPECNTSRSILEESQASDLLAYDSIYSTMPLGYHRYAEYQVRVKLSRKPLEYLFRKEPQYYALQFALDRINKSSQILEVGCGLGYLTYALNRAGYNAVGLDISNTAIHQAQAAYPEYSSNYICSDLEMLQHSGIKYDLIIATEVIEHIDDPIDFMAILKSLLNDNGLIYLTTPNKTSIASDIVWATDPPPIHRWWFSETSIRKIAALLEMDAQIISLRNYYKYRIEYFNLTYHRTRQELNNIDDKSRPPALQSNKLVFSTHNYVRKLFSSLKEIFFSGSTLVFWGNSGPTICAIIEKA